MADLNLQAIVRSLANERPVFHNEADMQHALAWAIHESHPELDVRLEYRPPHFTERAYVDIWLTDSDLRWAIELKYKTRALSVTARGERYELLNQSAQDIGRYDVLRDLSRVERLVSLGQASSGFVVFLTNDSSYWRPSRSPSTVDRDFRLHEGRIVQGQLAWASHASDGTMKSREAPIVLSGLYSVSWHDYAELAAGTYSRFRYTMFAVR